MFLRPCRTSAAAWGAELNRSESGAALIESIFAIVFLLTLVLGAIQVTFTLYARNVVQAAAHEGVRSAIDRGSTNTAALTAAREAVIRAAGSLVREIEIDVRRHRIETGALMSVSVVGRLRPIGPLPVHLRVTAVAHGIAPSDPRWGQSVGWRWWRRSCWVCR